MTEQVPDTLTSPDRFPESLSTQDAARLLGVTVPTVQRWLDQGILRGWKTAGGHRRIEHKAVTEYIETRLGALKGSPTVRDLLVVDEDPLTREFLRSLLSGSNLALNVRTATDGFEALTAVAKRRPTFLVVDVQMRHMDGVEMLRYLVREYPDLAGRILVCSNDHGEDLANLAELRSGIVVTTKPIDPQVLVSQIAAMRSRSAKES